MPEDIKDEIASLIAPFLACEEFYARYEAVKALGALTHTPSSAPLLSIAADPHEDIDMRMDAIESLVKINDPENHGAVTDLLRDESADIRLCAIRALGSMGAVSAADEVISLLDRDTTDMISDDEFDWDPQWDIQLEAVRALGVMGDEKAVAPIIRLYENELSYDLSEHVFKALSHIGSPDAIRFLARTLSDGAPQERRLIVQTIAKNKALLKEMKNELKKALGDKEPLVRAAATTAYAKLDEQNALTALNKSLIDPDATVRAGALLSLAEIGVGGTFYEKIATALDDPSPVVRAQSALLSQKCPIEMVRDKLTRLMEEDVDEVASHALNAFASLKAEGTAERLADIALDTNRSPYVRIQCVNLIASHYIDSAANLLPSPLDVEPRQVSIAFASCLAGSSEEEEIEYLVNDLRELTGIGDRAEPPAEKDKGVLELDEEEVRVKIGKKTRMVVRSPGATPGALKAEDLIRILSRTDHPKIKSILAECLTLKKSTIAAAAARAIARMGAAECASSLVTALDHVSPHVRSEAAMAVGGLKIDDNEVTTRLGELATMDRDPMVREASMSALGSGPAETVHKYLQKGLADPELGVRQAAVIAMGNCGDDQAIEPLAAELYNYGDFTHLRPDMYEALRKLDLNRVKTRLLETLSNKERHLDHWVAIQALGNVFG
ncbi:hypothetical protein MNBD_NITROSPINAE02-146 [hydrothermal vent metagenome]|uniref:Uncharacterized protein n=1 Tax=hydrothermal vent metagenome TaxID=652676 RepID=A0A3B1C8P2_9ZZZZ